MICCGINPNDVIDNSSRRQTPALLTRPSDNDQRQAQNNESLTNLMAENHNSRNALQIENIPRSNKNNEKNAAGAGNEKYAAGYDHKNKREITPLYDKVFNKKSDILKEINAFLRPHDIDLLFTQLNANLFRDPKITTFIDRYTEKTIKSINITINARINQFKSNRSDYESIRKEEIYKIAILISMVKDILDICDYSNIDKTEYKQILENNIENWLNFAETYIFITTNKNLSNIADYISKCKNEDLQDKFLKLLVEHDWTLFQFKKNKDYNPSKTKFTCNSQYRNNPAAGVYLTIASFKEMVKIDPDFNQPIIPRIIKDSISSFSKPEGFYKDNEKYFLLNFMEIMVMADERQDRLIELSKDLLRREQLTHEDTVTVLNFLIQFEKYNESLKEVINSKINSFPGESGKRFIRLGIALKFIELKKFDEAKEYLGNEFLHEINIYKILIEKNQLTDPQEINDFVKFALDLQKPELVEKLIESLKKQNKPIDDLKIKLLLAIRAQGNQGNNTMRLYEMMLIKLINTEKLKTTLLNHEDIKNNENEKNKINDLLSLAFSNNQSIINIEELHIKEALIDRYISDKKYDNAFTLIKQIGKLNIEPEAEYKYHTKLLEKLDSIENNYDITRILNRINHLYSDCNLQIYNKVILKHLVKHNKVETLEHILNFLSNEEKVTFLKEISKF